MPIYEYRCTECQHKFESLQKFSDAPLVVCPACGKSALTKLVSAAGFQLKGSGWYQTDFRGNGGAKKPEKSESADKPAADSAAKSDAPATKSETPASTSDAPAAKPAASPSTPSST
jgi:putative FmdB family regulatory protein